MGLTLPYSILGQARASASRSCQALGRITKSQPLILRELLLLIHLLCAIAWLGGMFFAYFCLRPAAAEVLKPPDRTFGRFLPYMAFAVTFILASGLAMLVPIAFAAAVPRLRSHCALRLGRKRGESSIAFVSLSP